MRAVGVEWNVKIVQQQWESLCRVHYVVRLLSVLLHSLSSLLIFYDMIPLITHTWLNKHVPISFAEEIVAGV